MPKGRFRSTLQDAGYRMATATLRQARNAVDLTLVDVAREAGVTEGMVAKVERQETTASPVLQLAYARKLGPLHGLFEPHAELRDEEAISHRQATLLLRMSHRAVTALCLDGVLPYERDGRSWTLGRRAVDSVAADRRELREDFLSFKRIERDYPDLPAWLLEKCEREGRLTVRHQDKDRLARGDQLTSLLDELKCSAAAHPCPGCGKAPKPGREWHAECIGRRAVRLYTERLDPEAAAEVRADRARRLGERTRAWLRSEEGRAFLDGVRKDPTELKCSVCGHGFERRASQARHASGRPTCATCMPIRSGYLSRARNLMRRGDSGNPFATESVAAFERAFLCGGDFENAIFNARPRAKGGPRDLALALAMEAAYREGFSKPAIRHLIRRVTGDDVNEDYVRTRLKRLGVRRRRAA
jgi:transcriptional regulator with XRE-family HTH domain